MHVSSTTKIRHIKKAISRLFVKEKKFKQLFFKKKAIDKNLVG